MRENDLMTDTGELLSNEKLPLTVTQAMTIAKRTLEGISLTVTGEVSELSDKAGYKAVYFTLFDTGAAMPCLMWRNLYDSCELALRPGMLVEATGTFSAYVPKGRMNFSVRAIHQAGEGDLRVKVAKLARLLEREGLMDPLRKRPIPALPQRIAVVTSPRGKAVHDCLRTLRRRYPLAEVLICGVAVEGTGAVAQICTGLAAAIEAQVDVILIVRGGGSYEDLMPFNDESLARMIASSPIPVVTGIGHEPDNSIADMVADMRCSTPTAAAEAVSCSIDELQTRLTVAGQRGTAALNAWIDAASRQVMQFERRSFFREPQSLFSGPWMTYDALKSRLSRAIPDALAKDVTSLSHLRGRLLSTQTPVLARFERAFSLNAARINDLSPLGVLARGYAIAYADDETTVVDSVEKVADGDGMKVRVADGTICCTVDSIRATHE